MVILTKEDLFELNKALIKKYGKPAKFLEIMTREEDLGFTHFEGAGGHLWSIKEFLDKVGRHDY